MRTLRPDPILPESWHFRLQPEGHSARPPSPRSGLGRPCPTAAHPTPVPPPWANARCASETGSPLTPPRPQQALLGGYEPHVPWLPPHLSPHLHAQTRGRQSPRAAAPLTPSPRPAGPSAPAACWALTACWPASGCSAPQALAPRAGPRHGLITDARGPLSRDYPRVCTHTRATWPRMSIRERG